VLTFFKFFFHNRCSNVNFSHREKCNKCDSSKPGVVQDSRTGRSGGFNERDTSGERERRERREQADRTGVYDEFGRKKRSGGGGGAVGIICDGDGAEHLLKTEGLALPLPPAAGTRRAPTAQT
jgi:hypothetical protein